MAIGLVLILTAFSQALGSSVQLGEALGWSAAAWIGIQTLRWGLAWVQASSARPALELEPAQVIVDDPTTLRRRQSIPSSEIGSIYVGPHVANWLLQAQDDYERDLQIGRFPQLPNLVLLLNHEVRFTQARRGTFPLWRLTRPPSPSRSTKAVWITVEDPDSAYLALMAWRGCEWAEPGMGLPATPGL